MKTLKWLLLPLLLVGLSSHAQTPVALGIQLYPGLSITGGVGTVIYQIQSGTNLGQTTNWVTLTNITLPSSPFLWVDPTSAAAGARYYRAFGSASTPTNMVLIPAGSFVMGDTLYDSGPGSDEANIHLVNVSAFYMDKYLVTKSVWDEVHAWGLLNGYTNQTAGAGKNATHPVQQISWFDAVQWCNARSQKQGLTTCYYADAGLTAVYKTNQSAPYVNWAASGYRLPTEAEWEKAARGGVIGSTNRFPWASPTNISHSLANYDAKNYYVYDLSYPSGYTPAYFVGGAPYTSPVGSFLPNGFGLYDMAGNVFEWCSDWYEADWYNQPGATQDDTRGPADPLSNRVSRGGSWGFNAYEARCSRREYQNPAVPDSNLGFRCVRGL